MSEQSLSERTGQFFSNVSNYITDIAKGAMNFMVGIVSIASETIIGSLGLAFLLVASILHITMHLWPGSAFIAYAYIFSHIAFLSIFLYMLYEYKDSVGHFFSMKVKEI
jgi:hypothetical protein